MSKRNITVILPPTIMKKLDKMYEDGLINSRTSVVEMAVIEWFVKQKDDEVKHGLD